MKIKVLFLLLSLGIVSASELTAPSFQLMNQNGENIELDSFKGKKVILEWTNHDCPFVQRHYETSNMQNLQEKYTEEGVIWLSIISSAEGKQGYVSPDEAIELTNARSAKPSHVLFDTSGEVGKMYNAQQIEKYNRSGIPLYIYWSKKLDEPMVLNEILTESYLREVINEN